MQQDISSKSVRVERMSIAAVTHRAAQPEKLPGGAALARGTPTQYSMSRTAFWLMLRRVAVIAGCTDLLFLGVFLALGLPVIAWTNLVSIGMYAAAYWLIGQRKNRPAVVLMWTEVLLHAISCTLLLGWDGGAHYFLLVFIPAIALSRSQRQALGALTFLLIVYLGLDWATQVIPRAYVLSTSELAGLRALCITVVFLMFAYTGRYYFSQVADAEGRLRHLATIDPLSGLWNRRHFLHVSQGEAERARRHELPLAVALADIDHFKQVNDLHGHPVGDLVIRHVSDLLRSQLRRYDLIGRWGGEEFILLFPSTDAAAAARLCERLREHVQRHPCNVDGMLLPVTVSFGVQRVDLDAGLERAVKLADEALYDAKKQGRNCTVVATGTQSTPV
jgi:diguanylate cyclase (GGDEF)-like protein